MAFGKKRSKLDDELDVEVEESPKKKRRGKKPKKAKKQKPQKSQKRKRKGDSAADIIEESVPEAILEEMKQVETFRVSKDGRVLYVGLLLNFDAIGGLGKRALKDEERGRIIEAINSGHILTLATPELLEENSVIIVPNEATLEVMSDFPLLMSKELDYYLVGLDDDGDMDSLDMTVDFDDMLEIAGGEAGALMDLAVGLGAPWAVVADESFDASDSVSGDSGALDLDFEVEEDEDGDFASEEFDTVETVEDDSLLEPHPAVSSAEPEASPEIEPEPEVVDVLMEETVSSPSVEPPVQTYEEPVASPASEPAFDSVETTDEVKDKVRRLFYNDDLGIEVTTEPFEAYFVENNPFIPIDEPPEGWLNGYVAQMVREANGELSRLHQQNIMKAQNVYLRLVNQFCTEIKDDLSLEDTNTRYGALAKALRDHRDAERQDADRLIAERRAQINDEWETSLSKVGDAAASVARQEYEERNGRLHQEELSNIDLTVQTKVDSEYQGDMSELYRRRSLEAQTRLAQVMNLVIAEVSKSYLTDLHHEQEEYSRFRDEMSEFIAASREDEIAHDNVRAEELRQSEAADAVMRDYQSRMEGIQSAAQQEADGLRREIADLQRRTNEELENKQQELDNRLADIRSDRDNLQERYDRLADQYASLDESKEREWKGRLNALVQDRDRWTEEANSLMNSNKRSNWYAAGLAIIGVIAALAVGFLLGMTLVSSQPAQVVVGDSGSSASYSQSNYAPEDYAPEEADNASYLVP